jgi:hypothetical protein
VSIQPWAAASVGSRFRHRDKNAMIGEIARQRLLAATEAQASCTWNKTAALVDRLQHIGEFPQLAVKNRFFAVWCGLKRPQEGELRSSFPAMR